MTLIDDLEVAASFFDACARQTFAARLRAHAARLALIPASEVHAAMQDAPHDGRDYRQARSALTYILERVNGGPLKP